MSMENSAHGYTEGSDLHLTPRIMEKKTKEENWKQENLNHFIHVVINDNLSVSPASFEMIWLCMKKYADQEVREKDTEIARLTARVKELEELNSAMSLEDAMTIQDYKQRLIEAFGKYSWGHYQPIKLINETL